MQVSENIIGSRPAIYLVGLPGRVGGAATKIAHLVKLLHRDFNLTILAPEKCACKQAQVREALDPFGVRCVTLKDLPSKLQGVGLGLCDRDFFTSGRARELKARGLKVVWSNEMMFPFKGEEEAVSEAVIDRVLFVSAFQEETFRDLYRGVRSFMTGNYIDPEDYPWRERANDVFTIGRLSRPSLEKYPLDFPVFYEELGLEETRYRVMAWSQELRRQYRWHHFGPEWELLPEGGESVLKFLYSLDLFVYPLGHRFKESWGRAVVEAMLTGCVPLVPAGHRFERLMNNRESGFICQDFQEFRACAQELQRNYPFRRKVSRQCSAHAREHLCDKEAHRRAWVEALSF